MPVLDAAHIVFAQGLDSQEFEPCPFDQVRGVPHRAHMHIRGNEGFDERASPGVPAAAGHLLDQDSAARAHVAEQCGGEEAIVLLPYVFAHFQRRRGVVRAVAHIPVILQPDLHPVGQAAPGDAFFDERLLLPGDGHPGDFRAELFRRIQAQRPPAAADVEEALARHRVQAELAADEVQFVPLGVRVGVGGVLPQPVSAGVGHMLFEDELVKLIGQIVVVADRRPVPQQAVQPAGDPGLRRRSWQRAPQHSGLAGEPSQLRHQGRGDSWPGKSALGEHSPEVGQGIVQRAGDVEFAGDISLGSPQFPRVPEQPAQGVGAVELHLRRACRPRSAAVPGRQPDGQVPADQRFEDSCEPFGYPSAGQGGRLLLVCVRHGTAPVRAGGRR